MMALLGWALLASIAKKRLNVSTFGRAAFIFMAVVFIGVLLTEKYRTHYVLDKFQSLLDASNAKVKIGGSEIDRSRFAHDFSDLTKIKQSGSSPTKSFYVTISTSRGSIDMLLRRDSRDNNLYWVFYPGLPYKGNLGYVETDLLAGIPGLVH